MHKPFAPVIPLLLFAALVNLSANAQNCACPDTGLDQLEKIRDENDSAAAHRFIKQLQNSSNKNCKAFAYTLEVWLLLANKKADTVLTVIRGQEKYINSLSCKNELVILSYLNYAYYYRRKNDFDSMSVYAYKSLQQAETLSNAAYELQAIKDLVFVFTRQNEDDKIPAYVKRAQKIIAGLPENYSTAAHYNWLAFECETRFTLTNRPALLDSAYNFAARAIVSGKQYNNPEQVTQSFRVYEAVSYHKGNIRQAAIFMDSVLFYARQVKVPTNFASLYAAKASDLLELGEKSEAIRFADSSLWYLERDFSGTASAVGGYLQAAQIYEGSGDLPKSYAAFKTYEHLKDSLITLQRAEKINELEQQYNKAKNEKTIEELALQKRIFILLAVAGLFALIGLVFFIRQQSLKNKQKILETEQRLNRARMNPHFFFNALASLQAYALQNNDGRNIAANISRFSNIMRETLESTYKEYVTIEQEGDFLREYLELQQIRFPNKFSYTISVASTIEASEVMIPSMILQPFVENSIEHGFNAIDYAGHIHIGFEQKDKEVHITIADNGKGLTASKENSTHISRASQIIKDRIYLLNIKLKTKAAFSINNNEGDKGVLVKIVLPLIS